MAPYSLDQTALAQMIAAHLSGSAGAHPSPQHYREAACFVEYLDNKEK